VGKVTGAGLIVAGVAVLVGAYLLPHQKAGPLDHEPIPIPGDIADAYGPLSVGSWRLYKAEEPVVVTLPSHRRPTTTQIPAINPHDKVALARELQTELKRAGCYRSEIDGVWSGPTRQAMKAFMDRVNAKLPTELPDSILLTLVRSHPEKVCGEPCPGSQSLVGGDRCVLTALMSQPKKEPPQSAPTSTTVVRAPLMDQGEGPMALAGPIGETPAGPTPLAIRPRLPSVAFKPTASSSRRFGAHIFRQLDRVGNH
jgi:hypothetical protein